MTNNRGIILGIIIAVVLILISMTPKLDLSIPTSTIDPYLAREQPEPIFSSFPTDRNFTGNEMRTLKDTDKPTFSIVEPNLLYSLFTFYNPNLQCTSTGTGGYCCDNNCDFSCCGSFEYCDDFCNPSSPSCPNGYVLVNNNQNCCPSSMPYYKAGYCFSEPKVDYPTSTGCPNSICDLVPYPAIGTGSVLYRPMGFDPTLNCQNKFGNSPTGVWFVDSSSACCFAERTRGEYIKGGIDKDTVLNTIASTDSGTPTTTNTLGLLCSNYKLIIDGTLNSGFDVYKPCTQDGATATCIQKGQCTAPYAPSIQCYSDYSTLYSTCTLNGGALLNGVKLAPFYERSALQGCGSGKLCVNNQCVADTDSDGVLDSIDLCIATPIGQKVDTNGCPFICKENEVTLVDGTCKQLIQTCIDNNLNNICDLDDPIVWMDPDTNTPICADRNADRICDGVESLFCKDSNNNKLCDSDEVKWLATYCLDENSNGICDGIESGNILCPNTLAPVCDTSTNITYPNQCFASAYNVQSTTIGSCIVSPTIIRLDCATGAVPIPSGYICDFETGWLIRRDTIYVNTTIDCRISSPLIGYTCTQVGTEWVWTKTELVNIDCYSRGCPQPNQLCQGGICIQDAKRCPLEVNCTIYGVDSVCDEEIGLCTKIQYLTVNNTVFLNNTTTITTPLTFASIPIWVKIAGGAIIAFILLRLF